MKNLSIINLMLIVLASTSWGQLPAHQTSLLNPLQITNRAQCALDSEKPADSIFIMIDGYNAGKVANSIAKIVGQNPDELSKRAMREFRLSIAFFTLNIMNKMSSGQLPLLPTNLKTADLPRYAQLNQACESNNADCRNLDSYLAEIWKQAGQKSSLLSVDRFSKNNFPLNDYKDRLGCYYIKKFSALQGQLHSADVDQTNLQDIALAYMNEADYLTGCFDANENLSDRYVTLQIDRQTHPDNLEKQGFDYWNSLKIYLSWAWRHTSDLEVMSPTFGKVFKSIALEESLIFAPNGCRSMIKPACDSDYLSVNSIRELAKNDASKAEQFKTVPMGTEAELLDKGVRAVNNDFLGTRSYKSAEDWLANFRKNLVQARGNIKNRYQAAVTNLNLLQDQMGVAGLIQSLTLESNSFAETEQMKNELYYMCTEIRLAADDNIDFLKTDIEKVALLKNMTQMQYSERRGMEQHVQFFKELAQNIIPVCSELEKQNYWNSPATYIVNKSGFAPWAKDMLQIKDSADTIVPKFNPAVYDAMPLLSWRATSVSPAQVICNNSVDCVRLAIKSMVDLYAVSTYADGLIPLSGQSTAANIFNPYSELKTCKIYDPWFQTRRMNKVFVADLISTALFGWNVLPIYIDINYSAPKVSSFNQLVEDGVIKFDPRVEKSEVQRSIVADFGPLVGAPCAVSLNNNGLKTFDFYSFTGITVNYCDSKQANEVIATKPSDVATGAKQGRSFCGGCSLNFTAGMTKASMTGPNPVKLLVYMFRTFSKLFTAQQDRVNIPISWQVNPAYAAEVYNKYGKIPSFCVEQLGQGLRCFSDTCAAKAAQVFEQTYNTRVNDVYVRNSGGNQESGDNYKSTEKEAWVKSDLCDGETIMRFSCNERNLQTFKVYDYRGFHNTCKQAIGK